ILDGNGVEKLARLDLPLGQNLWKRAHPYRGHPGTVECDFPLVRASIYENRGELRPQCCGISLALLRIRPAGILRNVFTPDRRAELQELALVVRGQQKQPVGGRVRAGGGAAAESFV